MATSATKHFQGTVSVALPCSGLRPGPGNVDPCCAGLHAKFTSTLPLWPKLRQLGRPVRAKSTETEPRGFPLHASLWVMAPLPWANATRRRTACALDVGSAPTTYRGWIVAAIVFASPLARVMLKLSLFVPFVPAWVAGRSAQHVATQQPRSVRMSGPRSPSVDELQAQVA